MNAGSYGSRHLWLLRRREARSANPLALIILFRRGCRWSTSFLSGCVVLYNHSTLQWDRLKSHWLGSKLHMYTNEGNILAWGRSDLLVSKSLSACCARLPGLFQAAGLTINEEETDAIFCSFTRAHIHDPSPPPLQAEKIIWPFDVPVPGPLHHP